MDEVIKAIFSAPIATLLIVAGVSFLAIAVLGKIGNIFEAGKTGRFASAAIGTALLIIGLITSLKTVTVSSSTAPSPAPVVTSSASSSPSIQPTTSSSSPESSSCLQQFFQGIPRDRVATIESGAQAVNVIHSDQPSDQPVAFLLEDNGTPVSAIKFRFYPSNQLFKIQSVVDAQCHPVEDYRNASRDGDKHLLQNWDSWKLQLGTSAYTIGFGYGSDSIELSVNRLSSTR